MQPFSLSPHASAGHWSARYIGRPWAVDFTCWTLVQLVQREQWGRDVPDLPEDEAARPALLRTVAQRAAWSLVAGDPLVSAREGDVLLLRGPTGPHVGVVIERKGFPASLLHNLGGIATEGARKGRAVGSVCIATLAALGSLGYGHLRLWRAAA